MWLITVLSGIVYVVFLIEKIGSIVRIFSERSLCMIKISELEDLGQRIVYKLNQAGIKDLTGLGPYYYSTAYTDLTELVLTGTEKKQLVKALRGIPLKKLRAQSKEEMGNLQLLTKSADNYSAPSILIQCIFGSLKCRIKEICVAFQLVYLKDLLDLINAGRLVEVRSVGERTIKAVITRLKDLGLIERDESDVIISLDSHVTLLEMNIELCKILFFHKIATVSALTQLDHVACFEIGLTDEMIFFLKTQLEAHSITWAKLG